MSAGSAAAAAPRHALVTGTSSGIGAAIAAHLLADGWRVTGIDRDPPSLQGRRFAHVQADVADLADVAVVRRAVTSVGAPDALVHAAGFMRVANLGKMDPDAGLAMWQVHVQAAAILVNEIADDLKAGSRIVLIGSRTAQGAAGRSQYAATKSALTGMARSWAIELAPRGITVNIVAPGATDTPMLRDPARKASAPVLPPIGRFIDPAEVAGTVAFFLGPYAGAITGQQITLCGGASL